MKKKTIEKLKFDKLTVIELKNLISIRGGIEITGGPITDPNNNAPGHAPVPTPSS